MGDPADFVEKIFHSHVSKPYYNRRLRRLLFANIFAKFSIVSLFLSFREHVKIT